MLFSFLQLLGQEKKGKLEYIFHPLELVKGKTKRAQIFVFPVPEGSRKIRRLVIKRDVVFLFPPLQAGKEKGK